MTFSFQQRLSQQEDQCNEFKEISSRNPVRTIVDTIERYLVSFLNSDGGIIYFGVSNDRAVVGVALSSTQQDEVRKGVAGKVHNIQPPIDPSRYTLSFHPIEGAPENTNLFVVEISLPSMSTSDPYYTSGGEAWVRLNGVSQQLKGPSLTDWIKRRVTRNNISDVNIIEGMALQIAERIRKVFHEHGLELSHLARFLEMRKAPFTIALEDLQSNGKLLAWLNETKIDWISHNFLIRREWLDGEDSEIHQHFSFDKRPQEFWNTVCQHVDALIWEEIPACAEAHFLRWNERHGRGMRGETCVFVVLAVPLARMSNERTIFKYITDHTPYPWTYGRTHIELRAWARLLFQNKNIPCYGREISAEKGAEIQSNQIFLRDLLEHHTHRTRDDWHPEDFGLSATESLAAKETETFSEVLAWLRKANLPCDEKPLRLSH